MKDIEWLRMIRRICDDHGKSFRDEKNQRLWERHVSCSKLIDEIVKGVE